MHFCAHCNYMSDLMYNLKLHQRNKHVNSNVENVEDQLPMQSEKRPTDWDLMEDSIVVLKIYKLLQRMKNK